AAQAAGAVHDARLLAQTQQNRAQLREQLEQLQTIYRLTEAVNRAEALEEIYEEALDSLLRTVNAERASILLLDAGGVMRFKASRGLSEDYQKAVEGHSPWSPDEPNPQPVLVSDVDAEPSLQALRAAILAEGIRAMAFIPLTHQGRLLGKFMFYYDAPHALDEQEVGLAQTLAHNVAFAIERRWAEESLQQRLAELSALFEVSGALRGIEGVEHMLPIIVNKAVESCHADCGSVSSVDERDESGETLICRYGTGARQNLVGARLRLGQGITGQVAQSGVPHLSPDFQHDPLLAFDAVTLTRLPEIASDVCVPLRVGEQVVGAMHVSTYTPRTFTEAEVRLLTAIADMAASAIHRAGLFEQLEHRVHELSALFDVGKMVTATLRIEDVLEFVVGAATQAVHAEGCYLFLGDEREERLVLRASQGFLAEDVGRMKYRLGEGLAGWVFLEGQAVNAPDLAADPRWKRDSEHEAPLPAGQANNALVVPLVIGKKALGVLGVVNKTGAPAPSAPLRAGFTADDESLLTALAGQTAIAIENARLYEDVRSLSIAAIRSLATAIDARDPYTRGHSEGVTHLAVELARELGWNGADLEMLEFAALLHDVGKIAAPDAVLRKVKPLTADEWTIIRLHPYHSAQIVKPVEPLQRIISWVYHHQEKWDGTGYPDGLKGEAIPLAARVIAVADAFNAMTTDRPYRKARAVPEALAEIERCAGSQFDPAVVQVFLRMMTEK
ncbi:MAG: GAF domain-containing protein, partial [Chloroflexi bacterium]|nr:GAF domain-containing protein [Chloroflexota bacterium]